MLYARGVMPFICHLAQADFCTSCQIATVLELCGLNTSLNITISSVSSHSTRFWNDGCALVGGVA